MSEPDEVDGLAQEDLQRKAQRSLDAQADLDEPVEVDIAPDRTKETRTPGFSRMRTDWHAHDAPIVQSLLNIVEARMTVNFGDVYLVMNDIFDIVREPLRDEDGEIVRDVAGWPVWAKHDSGRFVEDYTLLGHKERENFLFQITTRLFDWEQRAAEAWGEAMIAKALWEERFSTAFNESGKTDAIRENRAKASAQDERYFAIYETLYSRKAEALVRSMERIALRLSQTTPL